MPKNRKYEDLTSSLVEECNCRRALDEKSKLRPHYWLLLSNRVPKTLLDECYLYSEGPRSIVGAAKVLHSDRV